MLMLMISVVVVQNFEEYPEHRTNFFLLLQSVNSHCFAGMYSHFVVLSLAVYIKHCTPFVMTAQSLRTIKLLLKIKVMLIVQMVILIRAKLT